MLAPVNTSGKQVLANQPKTLHYNHFNTSQHAILLNFDGENGCFVLLEFHKDLKKAQLLTEKRGDTILDAIFVAKDRIVTLDKNKELGVCDFDGNKLKSIPLTMKSSTGMQAKAEKIFPASIGKILL